MLTFSQIWKDDPNNLFALTYRGFLNFASGKVDEALSDFNQVIDTAPKSQAAYSAYIYRAIIKYNGDFEWAVKDLEKAKKINPNNVWTKLISSLIRDEYWQQGSGRDMKADREMQDVYQLNPQLYNFLANLEENPAILDALNKFFLVKKKKTLKKR